MTLTDRETWEDPAWQARAHAWIARQLVEHDLVQAGSITQPHVRPWSTVMRVPTDQGPLYFKALPNHLAAEVRVTVAVAGWAPEIIAPVLASDEGQGWLLLADAGQKLRDGVAAPALADQWERLLPAYARLQQRTIPKAATLLNLGLPDRRLAHLPGLFAALLSDRTTLRLGQAGGMPAEDHARLLALQPRVEALADRLDTFGLPATIDHSDLHDGNIFIRDHALAIMDWGDAALSHPFFSWLVVARSVARRLEVPETDSALAKLRAAYLNGWRSYADPDVLEAAFQAARPLALIIRALVWWRALAGGHWSTEYRRTFIGGLVGWLQEFLAIASSPTLPEELSHV